MNKQEELLNILLKNKKITQEQLAKAKKEAISLSRSIEQILVEKKLIDSEELAKIKAKLFNLPYQDLLDKRIGDQTLNIIPIEVANYYKIICFDKVGKKLKVGILDPENYKAIEAISFLAKEENYEVEYYLISEIGLNFAIKQYKMLGEEVSTALKSKEGKMKKKEEIELEEVIKSAPISKIVSVIIRDAVDGGASDIHIEPLKSESRVRFRIDGILKTSLMLPKSIHGSIIARIKVMANLKLDETRVPQDGRIRVVLNDKEIDLRVSVMPLLDDEKVVMRILDTSKGAPELEELGFMGIGLKVIKNNLNKTDGLFLITGPTGSGKSTTLFTLLNRINKDGINISTLEDPIEYYVKGVNQSQVRPEIGFSFGTGLRSILRQDPDIIMVGEVRDNETAELAIHASLTGHFVLSTLHTNDAIGAISRLLDMKVEPFLLGSTLNTVVAQRLVRKICPYCRVKTTTIPDDIINDIQEEILKIPKKMIEELLPNLNVKDSFFIGKGCARCGNTGYLGRIAISEVIDINDELIDIIVDKARRLKLEDVVHSQQYINLKQDGVIKVLKGVTTMEEILRVAYD